MTRTGDAPSKAVLIALSGIAVGLPILIIVLIQSSPGSWPVASALLGAWLVVMLVVRSVILCRFYVRLGRKGREIAREDIQRLEARIDDASRGPTEGSQGKN